MNVQPRWRPWICFSAAGGETQRGSSKSRSVSISCFLPVNCQQVVPCSIDLVIQMNIYYSEQLSSDSHNQGAPYSQLLFIFLEANLSDMNLIRFIFASKYSFRSEYSQNLSEFHIQANICLQIFTYRRIFATYCFKLFQKAFTSLRPQLIFGSFRKYSCRKEYSNSFCLLNQNTVNILSTTQFSSFSF